MKKFYQQYLEAISDKPDIDTMLLRGALCSRFAHMDDNSSWNALKLEVFGNILKYMEKRSQEPSPILDKHITTGLDVLDQLNNVLTEYTKN